MSIQNRKYLLIQKQKVLDSKLKAVKKQKEEGKKKHIWEVLRRTTWTGQRQDMKAEGSTRNNRKGATYKREN